jgi:CBS domain-containing protein
MFTVSQVMAKDIIVISLETTIKAAAEILSENEFHALPVCNNEILMGIITTRDLIRYLLGQYNELI